MATKSSKDNAHSNAAKKAAKNVTNTRPHRQFAESNRFHRQVKLFAAGMMPCVRDRARNVLLLMRTAIDSVCETIGKIRVPGGVQAAAFLAASIAITVFAAFNILYTTGTTLSFNGVELGTVATAEEAEAVRMSVERSVSEVVGYNYTLEDSQVSYSTGVTSRSSVGNGQDLEDALSAQLGVVEHGYALYVDGMFVGATQTEGAFEDLLEQVAAPYRNENTVSIDFAEKVKIIECDLPVDSFTNLADVALLLNSTKEGEVTYTVKKGDCWSVIAQDHDMTSKELLALNPGYDMDKLQIGDVLIISNAVPYLTVTVTQMEYYIADVVYDIEYIDDPDMWEGDTKIVSKGVYGTADTSALVTYQGATEIEREIVSQTVITEPVTQVEKRGTAPRPSWAPTGSFRWPTNGSLTSKFGYRYIFGKTSFHGGIDIANRIGTDIVAADGGIVTFSGWSSGYGKLIIIDHQNGYKTYYGHCDSLLVGVGAKVHKGQHIAEMGNTGRSTGPHCHFEVRYNGERQNPLNYLP